MTITSRTALARGVATSVVACVCSTIGGVSVAAAATPAQMPDLTVTLPTVRVLEIPGFGLDPGRSEVVVTVKNVGQAAAHDVTVNASTVPGRFAVHTVLATVDAGGSATLSLGENTGTVYLGLATVSAEEAEADAHPANNTATGLRLLVGDFTGVV
ncbi:hypothetical protein ACXVUM_16575 [Williamsia sp. SKLECPSW1]